MILTADCFLFFFKFVYSAQCSTLHKIGGMVPPTVWNYIQKMMLGGINAYWFLFVRYKYIQRFCLGGMWLRVLCPLTCYHHTFVKPPWKHTTNPLFLHGAIPISQTPHTISESQACDRKVVRRWNDWLCGRQCLKHCSSQWKLLQKATSHTHTF